MTSFELDIPRCLGSTRLRALRLSDLPRFSGYRADAGLARYQSWEPMSHEEAELFLLETAEVTHITAGEWVQLAIADASSDQLAGDAGVYLAEDCTFAEVGFTLARNEQGKGHATRAVELAVELVFRISTVMDVRAVTDSANTASLAVLRRAGFVETGSRNAVFKGQPCAELLLARGRGDTSAPARRLQEEIACTPSNWHS